MSYAPGAPAAVWSMPSKVLGPGAKLTLMSLWARADHVDQQLYEACTVWAKAREGEGMSEALVNRTAEATGQTPRAVRQHLTKLRKLDLVCTHGRVAILTPTCQHCRESVSLCHCGVDAKVSPTDADAFATDADASATDTFESLQLDPPVPPSPLTPGEGDAPAPATHESDPHVHTRDHAAHPHGPDLEAKADAPGLPGMRGPRGQPTTVRSDDGRRVGEEGILPGVTDGAPVGETPDRLPSLCTHPQCRDRMVPSPLGTAQLHDCRRCHDLAAAAANEHLGSRLEAHRARIESHPPKPSRVELTQAVFDAVVDARMGTQLAGPRWSEWMLEALRDIGVKPPDWADAVTRVLATWNGQRPSEKPPMSNLWSVHNRRWQREAMGLGEGKTKGKFDGALGPKRRARDFDGHTDVSDAAKVSWV